MKSAVASAVASAAVVATAAFTIAVEPSTNVQSFIHQDTLMVAIPRSDMKASSTGKTLLLASTGGFKESDHEVDGQVLHINASAYIYPPRDGHQVVDDTKISGAQQLKIQAGSTGCVVTKEMVIFWLPTVAAHRSKGKDGKGGKMMLVTNGGNLKTGCMVGGQEVAINITAGFYPPRAR